ncbi:hypothetical protein ABEB36_008544 [Hypothenemus hampei]
MCPEKERLLREIQHQVSLYEQDGATRHCMDASKAVKQYSRSSADQEAPLPHELRPVSVLQMTMTYLMYNIMDLPENDSEVNIAEWFHFLWDRTRGIRKDITQQALCCQKSVELVEQCARFHIHCSARLMGEDPSVFDQKINTENLTKCLQTLKYMYHDLELKGEQCPNEAEFRAYIILLNLSDANFLWEVQKLSRDIQNSAEVKFALQVYSAFEKHNYVKFFKLIKSTTYLNACILMRYFVQVRVQAIELLIKCYTPPKSISFYPIEDLTRSLFFDDNEVAIDFMNTYGIGLNNSRTNFMLERSSFLIPEFPYVLDRSKGVETKRNSSVGTVVCGKEISAELYMQVQTHQVHNSFDKNGYLIRDELFQQIELNIEDSLLEDGDSRESTPERKSIVTNIFAPRCKANFALKNSTSPIGFSQIKEDKNSLVEPKIDSSSIFHQKKLETTSIFTPTTFSNFQPLYKRDPKDFPNTNKDPINLFKPKDEIDSTQGKKNIFSSMGSSETKGIPNIFSQKPSSDEVFSQVKTEQRIAVIGEEQMDDSHIEKSIFPRQEDLKKSGDFPKRGGFTFVLNRPLKTEVPNIFAIQSESHHDAKDKSEIKMDQTKKEEEIKRVQEEVKRLNEEIRRKNEEAAKNRRLEAERLKREEEEKRKQEELHKKEQERIKQELFKAEKARQEQEMKKRLAEMERKRKQIEETKKNAEIKEIVKVVVNKMIDTIELNIREQTLQRIRENIKKRTQIRFCRKWHSITVKRMKKRKALDCNPTFVHTRSVTECAQDLYSQTQDLVLSNMKRYKYGRPLCIPILQEQPLGRLELFHLTYSTLRRRLCELKEKWHQHIYWKVVISLPDINEMITGLLRLEETLKKFINWQLDHYGNIIYIEEHKTVTYCVEQQQGIDVQSNDSSAFIFIAKNFNEILQKRIFENLKNFGIYMKMPIVLILEDTTNAESYLENLKSTEIVSKYLIYSCNIYSPTLLEVIENALIFLAKGVERYPPLQMDTLYSFIKTNLCTEIWKKAGSYTRWNHEYNFCMRDPNIVISLYNEGLNLLTKIVLDETSKEYAVFPSIFRDYLPNKVPDVLPCDYRYFPNFWYSEVYKEHLKLILNNLKLPSFLENWPPTNRIELEESIISYCNKVFKNPRHICSTLINILSNQAETYEGNFNLVNWIEVIQIMAQEKLQEQDLKLPKPLFSDVFDRCIVVYNIDVINEYGASDWFYRNNPTIECFKKIVANKLSREIEYNNQVTHNRKRLLDVSSEPEDILEAIERAEKILRSPKNLCLESKSDIEVLNRSIEDLEDSIRVVKKIDKMNFCKKFIES